MKKILILSLILLSGCSTDTPVREAELPRLVEKGKLGPPYVINTKVFVGQEGNKSVVDEVFISNVLTVTEATLRPLDVYFKYSVNYINADDFRTQSDFDRFAYTEEDNCLVVLFVPDVCSFWHKLPTGLSSIGEGTPNYIIIFPENPDPYALPHELGHFFGLNHTFPTDGVEDTFDTDDPSYANIMNYSGEPFQTFTPGQFRIIQKSLEGRRNNVLIK